MITNKISDEVNNIEQNHQETIIAERAIAKEQNDNMRNQSNQENTTQNDLEKRLAM